MSIPLLAALVLVIRRELSRHRATRSRVVAGFWHVWWIAGVGMLVGGLVAVAVHAAGWLGLKRDQPPTAQGSGASGDADA